MDKDYILEMRNISKAFSGVQALDRVNFRVRRGTIHALMGENGAGKSTLMKILIGIYQPDEGEIIFKGEKITIKDTNYALGKGISMIHQELSPIPYMTVAENIFLGREPLKGRSFIIDKKKMEKNTEELLKSLEMHQQITPGQKMYELSISKTQMVEIAKAISYDADLIIMDEPTSAITEREVEHLFKIIKNLKEKGVSIIYISHKLDEIFKIADEITVLRDGKYIGTHPAHSLSKDKLIEMMVGRDIKQIFIKEQAEIGDVVLEVKNLTRKGKFENVSFQLRKGEILGIAGLMGSGRTELVECLFGVDQPDSGEIFIKGKKVQIKSPQDAIKCNMAFLTEDRKLTGCFLPLSVRDNMIVASIDRFIRRWALDKAKINDVCNDQKEKLGIKTPNLNQLIKNLSGGNQQKVLVARWLLTEPDILILDEPTRGIDVGAKAEIHKLMSRLAREGKAIIMISSELPEILGMSDRILIMHEGKLKGELKRSEATQEKIMQIATGVAGHKITA
ncbi:MAG: sugar ABC transporter ATP-binding protein [Firmicutes bacterium]|nr:sugar ABC transporter ATP-binding protein [Bacillota bacterium]